MAADPDSPAAVTVAGQRELSVTASPPAGRFDRVDRAFTIRCHSGRTIEGRWRGLPVGGLLEAARFPPATTHVRVTAEDGYCAYVPILDATRAFLGFDRLSVEVRGGPAKPPGTPRLLGPDIDSTRAVRSVGRLDPLLVPPGEDPEAVAD